MVTKDRLYIVSAGTRTAQVPGKVAAVRLAQRFTAETGCRAFIAQAVGVVTKTGIEPVLTGHQARARQAAAARASA